MNANAIINLYKKHTIFKVDIVWLKNLIIKYLYSIYCFFDIKKKLLLLRRCIVNKANN